MPTKTLLALTAAALFATCASSMILTYSDMIEANPNPVSRSAHIVDLPTVKVTPSAEDLAYFLANPGSKLVDFAAIQVRPEPADLAYYQARLAEQRIVNLAAVTVRPAAEDLADYLIQQTAQTVAAN